MLVTLASELFGRGHIIKTGPNTVSVNQCVHQLFTNPYTEELLLSISLFTAIPYC